MTRLPEESQRQFRYAKRRNEFDLGRQCAASCLRELGVDGDVAAARDRSPIWPNHIVGSITHSDSWTWVAVANDTAVKSVGIDTEVVVDARSAQMLRNEIATDEEWALANELGFDEPTTFTLVFSAKESFYKCWYPVTREFFDFRQASLVATENHKLTFENNSSNPNFRTPPGRLTTSFLVTGNDVFNVTVMAVDCSR